jgi:hypothetical protein
MPRPRPFRFGVIHEQSQLRKLGLDVAERTVSRLIPKRRTPPSQTWRAFLTLLRSRLSASCP